MNAQKEMEKQDAHQTSSDEIVKKVVMEMIEKIRKQTTKTAKKIMATLLRNVILF